MTVVVFGGATAAGKSALALAVAERVASDGGAEIVGADSRQLYRGLPIASAAPTADERARVRHHLYETLDPREQLTAAAFVDLADAAVTDIVARGKVALVVGGTGLYLRSLRLGLDDALPSDPAVRAALEAEWKSAGLPALVERLRGLDADAADAVDTKNPVRVIRALEIATLGGKAGDRSVDGLLARAPRPLYANALFFVVDHTDLAARIGARTRAMFAQRDGAGLADEEAALAELLGDQTHPLLQTIGLPEAKEAKAGVISVDVAVDRAAARTRQYARRQRTWFRKERWWTPIDAAAENAVDVVVAAISAAAR